MRYGEQEVTDESIDLTGGVSGSLQITLSLAGAQVDGVVQGKDDKPASEAAVVLVPDPLRYSLIKATSTGENGSFHLKGVAPGEKPESRLLAGSRDGCAVVPHVSDNMRPS